MNEQVKQRLEHYRQTIRRNGINAAYPRSRDPQFVFRYIENYFHKYGQLPPIGWHIHHLDHCKWNSNPENLIALPANVHQWSHRQGYRVSRDELEEHVNLWGTIYESYQETGKEELYELLFQRWPGYIQAMNLYLVAGHGASTTTKGLKS